ncbi:hypothetical protein XAB3213_3070003 [Xanthomonas citri pv. bilvae]|nr:hypothetical protein XAB3213_3070003 [Xanthomonas citri pv. bilvae]
MLCRRTSREQSFEPDGACAWGRSGQSRFAARVLGRAMQEGMDHAAARATCERYPAHFTTLLNNPSASRGRR